MYRLFLEDWAPQIPLGTQGDCNPAPASLGDLTLVYRLPASNPPSWTRTALALPRMHPAAFHVLANAIPLAYRGTERSSSFWRGEEALGKVRVIVPILSDKLGPEETSFSTYPLWTSEWSNDPQAAGSAAKAATGVSGSVAMATSGAANPALWGLDASSRSPGRKVSFQRVTRGTCRASARGTPGPAGSTHRLLLLSSGVWRQSGAQIQ